MLKITKNKPKHDPNKIKNKDKEFLFILYGECRNCYKINRKGHKCTINPDNNKKTNKSKDKIIGF